MKARGSIELRKRWLVGFATAAILCVAGPASSDHGQSDDNSRDSVRHFDDDGGHRGEHGRDEPVADRGVTNRYVRRALVSDQPGVAEQLDPDLKNAWGIAFNPTGFVWVSDGGTGKSTLYDGDGKKNTNLVVTVAAPTAEDHAEVTGIVFNSAGFQVTSGGKTGVSAFIFATEQGTISGWSPQVDFTHSIPVVDNAKASAIYKGLALAANGTQRLLYATDFHNGKIDVFDDKFQPVTAKGGFVDPNIPAGFAPFGIQALNGNLYVTFAKQDADKEDDVKGPGLGYVDVFNADGVLIRRLASRGRLNSPWGLTFAPADFGKFSGALLIGNFGDGAINAYSLDGRYEGSLRDSSGNRVTIDGLWGLSFGNGILNQHTNALFYTAGPNDERNGEYGRIDP